MVTSSQYTTYRTSVAGQMCTADNSDHDFHFQKHTGSLESNHDHPIPLVSHKKTHKPKKNQKLLSLKRKHVMISSIKNQANTHTNETFLVIRHRAYAPIQKRIWFEMISSNTDKEDLTAGSKQKVWSIMIYKNAFYKALSIFTVPTYSSHTHSYQKTWKPTVVHFQLLHFAHTYQYFCQLCTITLYFHKSNSLKSKAAHVS